MPLPGGLMAGWYPHPTDAEKECFWDGDEWTQKTRPRPLLQRRAPLEHKPSPSRSSREPVSSVVVAGYVCAVLIPILGMVLGLTQINRSHHGLRIVIGSVGFAFLYFLVLTG